ncbi:MAG TPA: HAMP domain-containing sensor histidine kinase [Hydrogenophaga sp.]|nr:HAMP domain-containing sensor histidine kinase [Hydrogenophaga sp.]
MPSPDQGLQALANQLALRRDHIVTTWRSAVEADKTLTTGAALPRAQMIDHIPALLEGFETQLREPESDVTHLGDAAAHGLHRWQQGFGLAEVSRELGHLNECVVKEIDHCAHLDIAPAPDVLAHARSVWASIFSVAVSASTAQYFKLQQMESASYVHELEEALRNLSALERQRATLWQQAAHDLRGNLGVVTNTAVGLRHPNLDGPGRDNFLRMLGRNMKSLHNLLDDITCLARLQGGQEPRRLETVDVAALLTEMGESLRVVADAQGLSLDWMGEPGLRIQGDPVKLQRIVQNLVLNAISYTATGRVEVSWGKLGPKDPERWLLQVKDTGPGLAAATGSDVLDALEAATDNARDVARGAQAGEVVHAKCEDPAAADSGGSPGPGQDASFNHGEGLGLAIVKRLCELLDATMQVETGRDGTCFCIFFPTRYPSDLPTDETDAGSGPASEALNFRHRPARDC